MNYDIKHIKGPLFSVLIANFNNGNFLEDCLQSIFAQNYQNWEIIIVDDASTDSSIQIYEKYKKHNKIHIAWNKKNMGCGYTKRKCVEHANGEICGFVDPDDTISPDALEIMTRYHIEYPDHSIIYSTHYICNEHLIPYKVADYVGQLPGNVKSWSVHRPVISQFATFKKNKYFNSKGISPIYRKAADKDLYYKLEDTGPVIFIDNPLYNYRHHANNISLNQHASVAYNYELTAKVMLILRHNKRKTILVQIPQTKIELTYGILSTALYELKNMHIYSAGKLTFQSIIFSPFTCTKLIISRISKLWKKRLL